MEEYTLEVFEETLIDGVLEEIERGVESGLTCGEMLVSLYGVMSGIHIGLRNKLS